jgi:hypothetical protein
LVWERESAACPGTPPGATVIPLPCASSDGCERAPLQGSRSSPNGGPRKPRANRAFALAGDDWRLALVAGQEVADPPGHDHGIGRVERHSLRARRPPYVCAADAKRAESLCDDYRFGPVRPTRLTRCRALVLPNLVRTAPAARLLPRRMCLARIARTPQACSLHILPESGETHGAVLAVASKLRLGATPILRVMLCDLLGDFDGRDDGNTVGRSRSRSSRGSPRSRSASRSTTRRRPRPFRLRFL